MNKLLSALGSINCAELDYMTWVQVGMALKAEGMDVSVWDEWSRTDSKRYHPGECQRRWNSFNGSAVPVTGATIYKLARDNGWSQFTGDAGIMDWNDVITYDGSGSDLTVRQLAFVSTRDDKTVRISIRSFWNGAGDELPVRIYKERYVAVPGWGTAFSDEYPDALEPLADRHV